jgi:hypothetical protein
MKRFLKGFFVVFIILGAGLLVEFLYFGLLGNKNDSYQAADTIFLLNGASERIKKGYELEIRGRRTDVGGQGGRTDIRRQMSEVGRRRSVVGRRKTEGIAGSA